MQNANYFNKFQSAIYSRDPEIIFEMILKGAKDLLPFVNSKLEKQNLSIEKIRKSIKIDPNGKIILNNKSTSKEIADNEQPLTGAVLAIGLAVVVVVVFYVVAISEYAVGYVTPLEPVPLEEVSADVAINLPD
jgi:hypothetical protein